jgi:adenine-specific DNA-methyltransferase
MSGLLVEAGVRSVLHHVESLSYGDDGSPNRVIEGDNVEVLAQLPELRGAVRCIYIDPPYNTAERWTHYEDGLDHDAWIGARARTLEALWPLMSDDGSLWISINDAGLHYLKVLADQLFGRDKFVSTIVWQHRTTRENRCAFSQNHEYVLVYAKDPELFRDRRNPIAAGPAVLERYKNPDNDPRGPWQSVSVNVQAGHGTPSQFYDFVAPNGRTHQPPKGRCWAYTKERMQQLQADGQLWFGRDGNGVPRLKRFLKDVRLELTPETLWPATVTGTTRQAKRHILSLLPRHAVFDTPKPEPLIGRIIEIASDPGDLVLDAYLGSGTTASAAHKLGRTWIGIELGAHAATHCAQRMRNVIDGESGGISRAVQWCGGGGFRYFRAKDAVGSGAQSSALATALALF